MSCEEKIQSCTLPEEIQCPISYSIYPELPIDEIIITPVHCDFWTNPIQCPLIIYIIAVFLGLILNLILLSRAPNINRDGGIVNSDLKWTAAVIGSAFTILIAMIFGAWIYYLCYPARITIAIPGDRICRNCIRYGWIMLIFVILFAFVLTYFAGLIMGEWINEGHIWAIETSTTVSN